MIVDGSEGGDLESEPGIIDQEVEIYTSIKEIWFSIGGDSIESG